LSEREKRIFRVLVPVFLPSYTVEDNCTPTGLPSGNRMAISYGEYWNDAGSIVMEIVDKPLQKELIAANKSVASQCAGLLVVEAFVVENPVYFRLSRRH
jgi:hypothetical protein